MTTVTVDQELLEQALEALKQYVPKDDYENKPVGNVMDDLRAALAQREDIAQNLQSRLDAALLLEKRRQEITQPRREWQGLTKEEINHHWHDMNWHVPLHDRIAPFARAIEAALKEKNNG